MRARNAVARTASKGIKEQALTTPSDTSMKTPMKSPTRRQTDLVIALSLAAQLVIPRAAAAQSEIRYSFYHGDKDNSAWVQPGAADAYQRLSARQLTTSARAGSRVCVLVINGNTVNYAYSLGVAVDSTGPAMPDLSKQLLPLAEFINLPKSVDQAKKEASAAASLTSNARTAVATARNTAANAAANAVAATPGKNPAPSAPGATQPSVNATSRLVEATREKAASDAEVLRSTAALNEALAIERAAQKKLADAERTAAALTDFIKKVMPIDSDVVAARKFVQAADHAEPLAKYADPLASGFGLR